MKILIAEDDQVSAKYLFKFLSSYGDCDITVDGIETMDAFLLALENDNAYDVIFLDVMMPKLDGLTVLRLIRGLEKKRKIPDCKRVKIIIATAMNETNTHNSADNLGCDAFLPKPLLPKNIIDTLIDLELIKK